jgi:hypothetical protein
LIEIYNFNNQIYEKAKQMNPLYIDFEYIASLDRTYHNLICVVTYYAGESPKRWVIHRPHILEDFKSYLSSLDLEKTMFLGWFISGAEVPCLYQIMGFDWVKKNKWVDLSVEYKMWVLTHPDFKPYAKKFALSSAIDCLGLKEEYLAEKEDIRDLILYDEENRKSKLKLRIENNSFFYTNSEMEKILFYCEQDVLILPKIAQKITQLSKIYDIAISTKSRLNRGYFCLMAGISYAARKGFPMDVGKIKSIFSQRGKIKKLIQIECNKKSNFELYVPKYIGPQNKKVLEKYTFNYANLEKYIIHHKLDGLWARTEKSKRLKLDEDYLDEMLSNYKEILEPLYHARNTLKQLSSTDLSTLLSADGYIKCTDYPFNQVTSRSSPKPKEGFILNLSPWLRMFIRPPPGRAYVYVDFNSQEILIAAILAKDKEMLDIYLNDPYLSTAIKTGFAPEGATKKTHEHIRTPFKGIVLGILYGLWIKSMSYRFMDLNAEWSQSEAFAEATRFFESHKKVFHKYWELVEKTYKESMSRGFFQVEADSGWIYFVGPQTKTTQLQNLPCQSYGAEMMRYAYNACVEEGIFVTSLHDALSFECAIEDAVPLAKRVSQIMCEQSKKLLGYDYMGTGTKIYTHEKPYYDKRGVETYKFIIGELGFEIDRNFQDVIEYKNIHKIQEIE